jgi:hypothetical protein
LIESYEFFMSSKFEVHSWLLGNSLNFELKSYSESHNLFSFNIELTIEMDGYIECIKISLPDLQSSISCFTISTGGLTGIVFILNFT